VGCMEIVAYVGGSLNSVLNLVNLESCLNVGNRVAMT
jgi:hypothetical protein